MGSWDTSGPVWLMSHRTSSSCVRVMRLVFSRISVSGGLLEMWVRKRPRHRCISNNQALIWHWIMLWQWLDQSYHVACFVVKNVFYPQRNSVIHFYLITSQSRILHVSYQYTSSAVTFGVIFFKTFLFNYVERVMSGLYSHFHVNIYRGNSQYLEWVW